MIHVRTMIVVAVLGLPSLSAHAQDPVMALDPTLMTGWGGGEAARRQAEDAAGKRPTSAPKRRLTQSDRALAGKWCPRKAEFRRKLGSSNRNYRQFAALCAEAGF